ncbi:undecaprenyl-phosphate galactose phosphotransferase WbaP [Deinococcus soli (ex Cha et al. 2016)]|uniref:undecaprenyl-phosphate galactose phosphotransferase WbaP n=1 Tax=Deinococcus soli (ex Cha et al. 2016) TaxID=1309411 RepID=UPI00166636D4|nr:undecaprenyl-phosphate galactose phosphotransferase WbaP [Deinococcus soli (ex Cha et al. 2016)]GGB76770.1 undecaprenyl-phosphate galactose phosphotransferase WbaP [Deinococcus soli (ex Cha et al. 2016)]
MGVLNPSGLHRKSVASLPAISSFPQSAALLLGDVLSLLGIYSVTNFLLPLWGLPVESPHSSLVWGAVWLCWRAYQGLYPGYGRSPQTELRLHVMGTAQVVAVQLAAGLALQRFSPSVSGTVLSWALLLLLSLFVRYGVRSLLIRAGQYGRPISVIGAGQTAAMAIHHLRAHPAYGLNPVAAYDDNEELHGTTLHGVPILGTIEQAIIEPRTEQALVSIPGARAETQQRIVNATYAAFPHTWVIPDLFGIPNQALQPHNIGSVASLEVRNNLRSMQARTMKRTIDLLGSGLGGLLLLPVLLLIALAIKLDSPGPAVYRARRLGRNGEPFDCFKFRSMHRDAEAKLKSVLDSDPILKAEFEATHKLKNDPRVTRVGAFLRKTSLDELPQLANVLLGTMSLVGPRPIVQGEVLKYGDIYAVYKQVRPGMTGYWQANGRSDTSYDERVGMDNFYVTNWTPWLDMVVLIQTFKVVFAGKGAY